MDELNMSYQLEQKLIPIELRPVVIPFGCLIPMAPG